ncbi:MAG: diphosphomevalonate decarboxylase [Xanthomonadaceae bacterium]|nr:diphosphomevalonate decarboxylase [Xanthomonadaceae bacterium]
MKTARARAHANIALIKYWGKRPGPLNLPAVGSLSITLDALSSETTVGFDPSLDADAVRLDGRTDAGTTAKVSATLDLLRQRAGLDWRARVDSVNNFPTGAGLASSASGFAALVVAADAALGLGLPGTTLSELARRGSGSAARSIFGGFVDMARGQREDGSDAVAAPLLAGDAWPLRVVIAVTDRGEKKVSSRDGMALTAESSPYFPAWVDGAKADLAEARSAIAARDFQKLAEVSEYSCLKMHASALAARPGVLYFNPATVALIHAVRELRDAGHPVFLTIDAGPQVKAVCLPEAEAAVADALGQVPGVLDIICTGLGPAATVLPLTAAELASC